MLCRKPVVRRAPAMLLAVLLLLAPNASAPVYAQDDDSTAQTDTVDENDPHDIDPALLPPEWGPAGLVAIPHPDTAVEPSQAADDLPPSLWLPNVTGASATGDAVAAPETLSAAGGGGKARGDFNNDGYEDLVVGVPFEDESATENAGHVHVLFGGEEGLFSATQEVGSDVEAALLGNALAVGNFNGDAFDDLALGAPDESFGGINGAGIAHVLYGTASRLTATNSQLWSQNTAGVLEIAQSGDGFGASLVAADFNTDGFDDLAIGAPIESVGSVGGAGMVHILFGSANRLTATGNQVWHQNKTGILGVAELADHFADSLGVGDFDGNGAPDLSAGVSGQGVVSGLTTIPFAGTIHILYSVPGVGIVTLADQIWNQGHLSDPPEDHDEFGKVQ